jgi:RHS repeat-associated protein
VHPAGAGGGEVKVESTPALASVGAGAFTVALWFKAAAVGGVYLISRPSQFTIYYDGSVAYADAFTPSGLRSSPVAAGPWTHAAVTLDGTRVRFYINGKLDKVIERGGLPGTSTSPLFLGCLSIFCPSSFEGAIDDVGIWSRVLSDVEIGDLAAKPMAGDGLGDVCDACPQSDDLSCAPRTCLDQDGDGFGVQGASACGHDPAVFDCNDADPRVHAGVADVCDGVDNNCDGRVDEGCLTNAQTTSYSYNAFNQLMSTSAPEGNGSYQYDLNGNLVSKTAPVPAAQIPCGHSRYLRLDFEGQNWLTFSELNVYDTNGVRIPMTVVTQSEEFAGVGQWSAEATVDQNTNTCYSAKTVGAGPQFIVYDLGQLRTIGRVEVNNRDRCGFGPLTAVSVAVSTTGTDAASWRAVVGKTAIAPAVVSLTPQGETCPVAGGGVQTQSYVYDARDRMVEVTSGGGTVARYGYDTQNLRMSMIDAEGERRVLLDGIEETGEYDVGRLSRIARYDHDPSRVDQLMTETSGTKMHIVTDALGSTYALADSAARVVTRNSYDVYGVPSEGSRASSGWGFTGRRHDFPGIVYARSRYLDAVAGRWIQADGLGTFDGPNRYAYVHNDPANSRDPRGLFSEIDVMPECFFCAEFRGRLSGLIVADIVRLGQYLEQTQQSFVAAYRKDGNGGFSFRTTRDYGAFEFVNFNFGDDISYTASGAMYLTCDSGAGRGEDTYFGDYEVEKRLATLYGTAIANNQLESTILHEYTHHAINQRPWVFSQRLRAASARGQAFAVSLDGVIATVPGVTPEDSLEEIAARVAESRAGFTSMESHLP